jgi:hypothetical protein
MPLASLLEHTAFDDETARLLMEAFQDAWKIIQLSGSPLVAQDQVTVMRAILAEHIMRMAMQGERDLEQLIDGALNHLRVSQA